MGKRLESMRAAPLNRRAARVIIGKNGNWRMRMPEVLLLNGFNSENMGAIPCADGGGRIDCYPLFDGAMAMRVHLETHGFSETRAASDQIEINFCAAGRFESRFSARDHATLKPGDMALSTFDGIHGAKSESRFPLGYYEGVCISVDCSRAEKWMREHAAPMATDLQAMRANLLGGRWYAAMNAGPRCEHVFRELLENLPYFDREYLMLKLIELFMLLKNVPRAEQNADYCSAEQLRLARHLRDHLISNRSGYVSLAHLAEEHQISVSYLQKLFRQAYGAPIYHYIKEYRLEQAAVELARSGKRIVEIALDAGYDSASKFSEAFKKRYGATPTEYRAAARLVSKRNGYDETE